MKKLLFLSFITINILAICTEKTHGIMNFGDFNNGQIKSVFDEEFNNDFDELLKHINSLNLDDESNDPDNDFDHPYIENLPAPLPNTYSIFTEETIPFLPSKIIDELYLIMPYFLTCAEKLKATLPTKSVPQSYRTAIATQNLAKALHQFCDNLIQDLHEFTIKKCPKSSDFNLKKFITNEDQNKQVPIFVWTELLGDFLHNKQNTKLEEWLKDIPLKKRGNILLRCIIQDHFLDTNNKILHGFSPLCSFFSNLTSLQEIIKVLNACINNYTTSSNNVFLEHIIAIDNIKILSQKSIIKQK